MKFLRVLFASCVLLVATASFAKEKPDPFPEAYRMNRTAFVVAATAAKKAKKASRKAAYTVLSRAIGKLAAVAVKAEREDGRKDALDLIRPHLRYTKSRQGLCIAAIKGVGILEVKNSSRFLLPLGQEKRSKKIPRLVRATALDAVARIADRKSQAILLDYLDSPKPDDDARYLAVAAARALARYADVPAKRKYAIMYDVMKAWANLYGAAGGLFMTSADASEWWASTHRPLVNSFNKVLGLQLTSYKKCEAWWRAHRRQVQKGKW